MTASRISTWAFLHETHRNPAHRQSRRRDLCRFEDRLSRSSPSVETARPARNSIPWLRKVFPPNQRGECHPSGDGKELGPGCPRNKHVTAQGRSKPPRILSRDCYRIFLYSSSIVTFVFPYTRSPRHSLLSTKSLFTRSFFSV